MSLNKYMHPRNIYKSPPDFAKLSQIFPEFSKVTTVDTSGKVTIDFKDPHALRVLTKCLLKSDFNLEVDIPEDRLVPTLPLRLNYILWIEDILSQTSAKIGSDVCGLDIGTGACAIYPLLAAVKNKWTMVGTETDAESLIKAKKNVENNNLHELITVKKSQTDSLIEFVCSEDNNKTFEFCMCNPPFYSSIQELCESRSPARPPPKNGFTGSPQELITEGGELKFCRKLIKESQHFKNNVIIFTTMIGHKCNMAELLQDLKTLGIKHTHTEFCQGRVTRWGLAWTYQDYDLYKLVPPRDKLRKKNVPMIFLLPKIADSVYDLDTAFSKVKSILTDLCIAYKIIEKRGYHIYLDIKANTNTWSNQRKKRRQMKQTEHEAKKPRLNSHDPSTANNINANVETTDSHDTAPIYVEKQIINTNHNPEGIELVHAFLKVFKKENDIFLGMEFLNGTGGKESLHQIIQYIKNNWK